MLCCAADATAVGFRVLCVPAHICNSSEALADGQWVQLAGRLDLLTDAADPSELVRVKGVYYTALHTQYRLIPESIESIEPPDPPFIFDLRKSPPFAF